MEEATPEVDEADEEEEAGLGVDEAMEVIPTAS